LQEICDDLVEIELKTVQFEIKFRQTVSSRRPTMISRAAVWTVCHPRKVSTSTEGRKSSWN